MKQGRIVVITGAPGTGKTTAASISAKGSDMEKREIIGKLENGKYNPSLKLAMDIAKVFGRLVEEIFIFEDKNK